MVVLARTRRGQAMIRLAVSSSNSKKEAPGPSVQGPWQTRVDAQMQLKTIALQLQSRTVWGRPDSPASDTGEPGPGASCEVPGRLPRAYHIKSKPKKFKN